jgi:hypothetical protein
MRFPLDSVSDVLHLVEELLKVSANPPCSCARYVEEVHRRIWGLFRSRNRVGAVSFKTVFHPVFLLAFTYNSSAR